MTPAVSAPAILRRDFPGWLSPMMVKELRQGLQTRGFVGTLVVFQILMALAMLPIAFPSSGAFSVSTGFFWTVLGVQLLFVTPARAVGGLQEEVDARTLDLLLLTRLDATRIVVGKWVSLLGQAFLLVIAMLPYGLVRWFAGSVNLLDDARLCAVMVAASAMLTAGGLWAAGVARVLRIVLVIAAVFGAQIGSGFLMAVFGVRSPFGASGSPFSSWGGLEAGLAWYDAALVTVFFLVCAIRNIAPLAANYAPHGRLLALLAMLPVPYAAMVGAKDSAHVQLVFAGVFTALIIGIEFARAAPVMARHWRPWVRRGAAAQIGGLCLMPGWESALCFATGAAALWAVSAAAFLPATTAQNFATSHLAWLALLSLSGLAFPAVVLSFVAAPRFSPAAAYSGLLLMAGAAAGVIAAWASIGPKWAFLRDIATVIPFANVFVSLDLSRLSTATFLVQGVVSVAILAVGFRNVGPYVRALQLFTVHDLRVARETGIVPR